MNKKPLASEALLTSTISGNNAICSCGQKWHPPPKTRHEKLLRG